MAAPSSDVLNKKQKVQARVDLPGVPAGTAGVVVFRNGLTWIRYRVSFANGVELNLLDRAKLALPGEPVEPAAAPA